MNGLSFIQTRSLRAFFPHRQSLQAMYTGLMLLFSTLWLLLLAYQPLGGLKAVGASNEQLVLFTASWCATCAVIEPDVKGVATSLGVPYVSIDVDSATAQSQAKQLGIAVPTRSLPQVFYLQNSQTSLVLDGSQVSMAETSKVKPGLLARLFQLRK